MKLKRAIVLSLLMLFSVGSLALGGEPGQRNRNDRNQMENRENGNSNRGNWRGRHRRRHRRHWRKHNM